MAEPVYTEIQKEAAYAVITDAAVMDPNTVAKDGEAYRQKTEQDLRNAIRVGAIPLVAAALLKVQGYPPYDPEGNDQARELTARITQFIKLNGAGRGYGFMNPPYVTDANARHTAISEPEILTALGASHSEINYVDDNAPFAQKRLRAIPVNENTAVVISAVDAMMNPNRYTNDGTQSIESVVAANPVDTNIERLAMTGNTSWDEARKQGSRLGLQLLAETGYRYNPSLPAKTAAAAQSRSASW